MTHYAVFGRFNIYHAGHSSMLSRIGNNCNFTIGIANSGRNRRNAIDRLKDIRTLELGTYDTLICNNLFQFLDILCTEHEHVTLILGTDRFATSAKSLMARFTNLLILEQPRTNDLSSSLCRRLYTECNCNFEACTEAFVEHGLCATIAQASVLYQATREDANDT